MPFVKKIHFILFCKWSRFYVFSWWKWTVSDSKFEELKKELTLIPRSILFNLVNVFLKIIIFNAPFLSLGIRPGITKFFWLKIHPQSCCVRTTQYINWRPTNNPHSTKGNTKLRQIANLNETQVHPKLIQWDVNVNWII